MCLKKILLDFVMEARQISLVKHVTLDFKGTVLQGAIVLGDVDADDKNELVVGDIDGNLSM